MFLYQMERKTKALLEKRGTTPTDTAGQGPKAAKAEAVAQKPGLDARPKPAHDTVPHGSRPSKKRPPSRPKPALRITVKSEEVSQPVSDPVERSSSSESEAVERSSVGFQTVGLHNVPKELVDALKTEAKSRSVHGKRVSMTDVALECIRIGLADLIKNRD